MTVSADSNQIETPSGKGARDENFPVGSFLIPKHLRPHVSIYYDFARAADDIADNGDLSLDDRIWRLTGLSDVLTGKSVDIQGFEKARALRRSLDELNISTDRGSHLIDAFVQDCRKFRYQTWQELLGYCALSANPVGRYLLDLHGEDPTGYRYSDALCTVLQVVNHLQDCREDKHDLDRIYIISEWLNKAGGSFAMIDDAALSPAMRSVFDQMLDTCEDLMVDARQLPSRLNHRSLAMESAIIVRLADRLIRRLRNEDALAKRVALSKLDFVGASAMGTIAGFFEAGKFKRSA